ncbi:DUF2294 domain-containing protein [Sediminibacillus massiliensis]|uniref:DUF2294 domain-containing protein n=1 Tax=Sediminibacillus massiliensis TaxID=1926277 RepID=UPI0009886D4A|nr:DUF2294 domain-containing protein [Sediminibacillus massiliensis]
METKNIEAEIASFIGKLIRDNFGKGPSSVYVTCVKPFITIYLRDFLAPMERVLLKQGNDLKVQETRDLLMEELLPEIKATIKATAQVDIHNIYYDWGLENKTGIIIAEMDSDGLNFDPEYLSYPQKEEVHQEIDRFSAKAQKVPERTDSYLLNTRTLVVVREGILVSIEKELLESGFEEQLILSKRRLEKKLLDRNFLEKLLQVTIQDVFADWNFAVDKGYLVLILKPN